MTVKRIKTGHGWNIEIAFSIIFYRASYITNYMAGIFTLISILLSQYLNITYRKDCKQFKANFPWNKIDIKVLNTVFTRNRKLLKKYSDNGDYMFVI